ncbi:MAG: DUF4199 domain-containing protein [Chitinophagaceae bacterium]
MKRKTISHFIAGLVTGAVYIILFVAYYYKGLSFSENTLILFAPYLLSFLLIFIAVILHGNSRNNHVTFGELFNYGFKSTAIFVLVISAFMFFFLRYSDYKKKLDIEMTNRIKSEKELTGDKKELAMELKGSLTIIIIGGAIFTNVIIGTVASLLAASVARKDVVPLPDR